VLSCVNGWHEGPASFDRFHTVIGIFIEQRLQHRARFVAIFGKVIALLTFGLLPAGSGRHRRRRTSRSKSPEILAHGLRFSRMTPRCPSSSMIARLRSLAFQCQMNSS
jgi:hypothetical protein